MSELFNAKRAIIQYNIMLRTCYISMRWWWYPLCTRPTLLVGYFLVLVYDFLIKTVFSSSLQPVVCRRVHVMFVYSGVQHILYCVVLFVLCLVYPMLTVSLDCPFLIAPSVFSNVYLTHQSTETNYPDSEPTRFALSS